MRSTVNFLAILISGLFLWLPAQATAQARAEAAILSSELAVKLAHRSLDLLDRAEESYDPGTSLRLYREGRGLAQQALAADDLNADAHFALFAHSGRVMLAEGVTPNPVNLWRISRELDRALELDPEHPAALATKGGLYRQLPTLFGGSLVKAEQCLRQSIQNNPDSVGARIELARTYQEMDRTEKALDLLTTASAVADRLGKTRKGREARQLLAEITAAD